MKQVTDFANSTGTETFTVASGGTANAGDKYQVFPPIGAQIGNLSTYRTGFVITATAAIAVKVAGYDFARGKIRMMAALHTLGVEE